MYILSGKKERISQWGKKVIEEERGQQMGQVPEEVGGSGINYTLLGMASSKRRNQTLTRRGKEMRYI